MKRIVLLLTMISTFSFTSCESTTYQELSGVVTNPTYEANIAPIFNAECVSCHSAEDQFPPLETYDEVKDGCINGTVFCRIEDQCDGIMPPSGKMPQATIDMINLWAENGYIEK